MFDQLWFTVRIPKWSNFKILYCENWYPMNINESTVHVQYVHVTCKCQKSKLPVCKKSKLPVWKMSKLPVCKKSKLLVCKKSKLPVCKKSKLSVCKKSKLQVCKK
jgi:hypothetical protein